MIGQMFMAIRVFNNCPLLRLPVYTLIFVIFVREVNTEIPPPRILKMSSHILKMSSQGPVRKFLKEGCLLAVSSSESNLYEVDPAVNLTSLRDLIDLNSGWKIVDDEPRFRVRRFNRHGHFTAFTSTIPKCNLRFKPL